MPYFTGTAAKYGKLLAESKKKRYFYRYKGNNNASTGHLRRNQDA